MTSQTCPYCAGHVFEVANRHMRVKECKSCKVIHHRDTLAAEVMAISVKSLIEDGVYLKGIGPDDPPKPTPPPSGNDQTPAVERPIAQPKARKPRSTRSVKHVTKRKSKTVTCKRKKPQDFKVDDGSMDDYLEGGSDDDYEMG